MDELPEYELVVRAGMPFERTYPILQGKYSAPVPFASVASGRAQVRETYTSEVVLHSWTVAIVDVGGHAHVRLSATEAQTEAMLDWPVRRAQWDLEVTDSDGEPHTITEIGTIRIKPRITQ